MGFRFSSSLFSEMLGLTPPPPALCGQLYIQEDEGPDQIRSAKTVRQITARYEIPAHELET